MPAMCMAATACHGCSRARGQFRLVGSDDLAGPCLWHGQRRTQRLVQRPRLPLHVFPWQPEYDAAGLTRDALYLLRPDTYVALADTAAMPGAIERYLIDHNLHIGTPTAARP